MAGVPGMIAASIFDSIRRSLRSLRARPHFTAFAIVALGLGIGANCALFAVLNSLLMRPLPYADAHQIVEISGLRSSDAIQELNRAGSFNGVAAFGPSIFQLASEQGPKRVYGIRVTANLFQVLGVKPALGRTLTAEDSDEPVLLLSYQYWRQISGQPDILGRSITIIEDQQRAVAGVLPADFTLQVRDANIFVPGRVSQGRVIARLKPGVSPQQAEEEAAAIIHNLERQSARPDARIRVIPVSEAFRPRDASNIWLFQGAVAVVLLITCANLANLLLVNGAARRREFAIRAAIGGTRSRIFTQLLTENTALALAGGCLGLVLAHWSLEFINATLPANITRVLRGAEGLSIDARVVAFTFALSLCTVLLFGIAPAASALRFDLISSLRDSSRASATGRQRFGRILVAAEVALALMLLVTAGLTLKNLMRLYNQDLGFTAERVLRTAIDLPRSRYPSPEQRTQAFSEFLNRVKRLPGVESAAIIGPQLYPFGGPLIRGSVFRIMDRPEAEPRAEFYYASPDYFRTMRIPLFKGRMLADGDTALSAPVAVVSDVVAARYWQNEDPIGKQIRQNPRDASSPVAVVVGVVGNVRNPVGTDFTPIIYVPLAQAETANGTVMIRSSGEPLALASAVRREILAADPNAAEYPAADLAFAVKDYVSPQRFATSLFGMFAGVGLLLAAIGIYAVTRHWVSARVPEIGIRMAVGANGAQVLGYVLRQAAISAGVGVLVGLGGALALQRVIASQLHDLHPVDPIVFASVAGLIGFVSIASALAPAIWASRVDPVIALRQE